MEKSKLQLLILFCAITFYGNVFAQLNVSGVVSSELGELIPGVNIQIKGTTTGVSTDFDGKFRISVPDTLSVLAISYIGFEDEEIVVGNQTEINITLNSSSEDLDEVIVIGYGTQSLRKVTGSIASVDMEEVNKNLPNTSVAQSLSGITGVQFSGDGRPGQSGVILIRGQNSLSGGTNPLIVLDGIVFSGSLNDINPNDIKSMNILKDASATAIYGYRAANGVILITSKKGTTEKPTFNLNVFSGITSPENELKLLSPERYLERKLDFQRQTGNVSPGDASDYLAPTEKENYLNGISNNAWDIISQPGIINSLDFSVSGRSDYVNYYLSNNISKEDGLIFNDKQERQTFRANIDTELTEWLNVGVSSIFSNRDTSGQIASIQNAYRSSPFGTFYYPDGEPTRNPVPDEAAVANPMRSALLTTNERKSANLFGNFYAKINVPVGEESQLTYRVNYSPNLRWRHDYNYERQDMYQDVNTTAADKTNESNFDWVLENILTYRKDIGEDHTFDLTLMYGRQHTEYEQTYAEAGLLSVDGLGYNNLGLGTTPLISSNALLTEGVSFMGRLNYQFKNRYLFTLTARRDGSSVFSSNNKYATFPSGAFGWIISDEPFMEDLENIDILKLRLSYGAVGNQAIDPYQSLSSSDTVRYAFGDGGPSSIGVITNVLGNSDLKWETTHTFNAAIDFGLFDSRLDGSLEFYNSKTTDLLVNRTIPVMSGFTNILTNIGEVNNKGVELSLNSVNVSKDKFEWTSSISFSYNKNKIVHLFETDIDGDGKEDDDIANSWFIGQPINSYYDYVFKGIYQLGNTDIPGGMSPGDVRVDDLNGDGNINSKDRKVVGSGSPNLNFGVRNNFKYGNFSLSVFINSLSGHDATFNLINPLVPGRPINQVDMGWWTPENSSNTRPSLTYTNPLGTNWYLSRNFVRIKDVSLGYEFDKGILDKFKLSSLSAYISAKNLYTITNWKGTDPESGGDYTSNQGTSNLYPMPSTFTLGLNLKF